MILAALAFPLIPSPTRTHVMRAPVLGVRGLKQFKCGMAQGYGNSHHILVFLRQWVQSQTDTQRLTPTWTHREVGPAPLTLESECTIHPTDMPKTGLGNKTILMATSCEFYTALGFVCSELSTLTHERHMEPHQEKDLDPNLIEVSKESTTPFVCALWLVAPKQFLKGFFARKLGEGSSMFITCPRDAQPLTHAGMRESDMV